MARRDDGLPAAWVCILAVITMPFWLPPALLIAALMANWRIGR